MKNNKIVAYILIGIGALFLLSHLDMDTGWLWVGLVGAAFLWGYVTRKSYGLLVAGCILTGVAVGLLLEESWGWNGAFLISLGVGFVMIDRLEPKTNRWPLYLGGLLALLGIVVGLSETGIMGSFWFALVLIGAGAYLLGQNKKEVEAPRRDVSAETFTTVAPQPTETAAEAAKPADRTTSPRAETPRTEPVVETSAPATAPVQPLDTALYERLESWRRETAKREDRAAYLVLTNESLRQIAAEKPQTFDALKAVKGIGPVKLERYGEAILALIRGEKESS